jgi:ADP-heptose:LPS heptosyltransferase
MRILFITATRIGDAVLSTGLLAHLLQRYPQASFTIACGPAAAGIFARMPRLQRLIVVEKQTFDRHWLRLWWQVSRTVWDLVVDLRGSALSFTIPARRRAIMQGGRRPGHRLDHLAAVLSLPAAPLPVVWIAPEDDAYATRLLGPGPAIGLGPTANWSGKIWPAGNFAALTHALIETAMPGARPVIFAGPGAQEQASAAPLLAALPNALDLTGRLTLAQAAACLARCAIFIGNDSGLMHLAAAAGTPTLGLFGPSSADEYAPAGRRTAIAVAPGPPGNAAMADLSVAAALQAAQDLLSAHASAAA